MTSRDGNSTLETFAWLSNEYAQALEALAAIEQQASTLLGLGGADDLRVFLEQFLEMAERARARAIEHREEHFAEWFSELIQRAESLRSAMTSRA